MILQVNWILEPLWSTGVGFILLMVCVTVAAGIWSKSFSVPAAGGYLMFAYYASEAQIGFLEQINIISLVVLTIGIGFKFWRLEGAGA